MGRLQPRHMEAPWCDFLPAAGLRGVHGRGGCQCWWQSQPQPHCSEWLMAKRQPSGSSFVSILENVGVSMLGGVVARPGL
jgi:hypothetical protein